MTSHELARLLLARRDNNVSFLVHVDDGKSEVYNRRIVRLLGDDESISSALREAGQREPMFYDSTADQLVVQLGEGYTGEVPS